MARQDFITQLQQLGYTVEDRGENRIAFPYKVPVGRFLGQDIWLGFVVGDDFPLNPPSGPHVSPQLLPLNTVTNVHPAGGIHPSLFGPEWEYWSRPFPEWHTTDRSVRTYLSHIRHLVDTQ